MAAELTLGKYHYWDENLGDNIKRFHFFEDNNGKDHHIDFSPYYSPTESELDAVRKFVDITGRIPDRMDNNGSNFSKHPIRGTSDMLELLDGMCCCGNPECTEQYSHWSRGF